jgi:YD repeat-containing protein
MGLSCRNRSGWVVAYGAALSLSFVAGAGHAQTVSPTDEYRKLIAAGQSIQPLGMRPFGESINLYNGSLSFEVTDISVPGTGPTLQLSRSLDTAVSGEDQNFNMQRPFGDWDLDIPRIETETAFQTNVDGWETGVYTLNRCTNFTAPPPVQALILKNMDWQPNQWWYGYHVIIPGNGDQYVGWGGGSNLTPSVSGLTFPLGTKQDWRIACGVTASDGGEGFLAVAPDGTRYTFAYLIYRPGTFINRTTDAGTTDALERRDALMYVTKIQDRFGNTLTYNWSGNNLSSIVASDGRELDFAYYSGTPLINTITVKAAGGASARTWTYAYNTSGPDPALMQVQLPDGSAWAYQMGDLQSASLTTFGANCPNDTPIGLSTNAVATGSMTTPSGLTATFTMTPMLHGRSYVPEQCLGAPSGSQGSYPSIPNVYAQFSLTQEVLTGPGIPSGGWTWNWSYSSQSALNASWTSDACASSNDCPDTVYTDAEDPLTQVTRYTYSNRFDATEGQLLGVDKYSGAAGTTELQSVVNIYAAPTNEPWPVAGDTKMTRINKAQIGTTSPLQSSTITLTQQNTSFSTAVNTFDNLARATSETESSSLGYSKTDTTSYSDDTTNWVLGSVTQTTTNGTTVSQTYFDSLDRPTSEYTFGRWVSTKGWNGDGTLHTIEDGNAHTTTFSNWYRGVPQSIAYADGSSVSAGVNGNGWITSVTDENGFTTSYGYDQMGRIASITYPSADDVAWNQTVLSFAPVGGSEYGIAAGHWKQTVQTGNDYTVTYFDAFWRPLVTEHYDSSNRSGTLTQVVQQYDGDGHKVFTSYPTSSATSYTQSLSGAHTLYDALDRVTELDTDSELGTLRTVTHYLTGFQTQVTDPRGYATTDSYEAYGKPDTSYPVSIVMPEGETTTISRDVFGKPLSITRSGTGSPSVARNYTYNSYQQLCGRTEPETGTTGLGYDGAGNLAWSALGMPALTTSCYNESQVSSAGREVPRTYDGRNRLKTVTYPDGSSSTIFGYDPDGVLSSQTDNNGANPVTTTYRHDKRRLLTSETVTIPNAPSFNLGYGYDGNGHLTTTTYPDGRSVGYAPNAVGQATQAGPYATGATYYPDDAIASYTYGNGLVHTMAENARQLPSRVTDSYGGTSVHDDGYVYDGDGDVGTITDYTAGSTGNRSMSYDGLDRLKEADSPMFGGDDKAVYAYDVLDNLSTARVGTGISYGYHYDTGNHLQEMTNTTNGAVVNSYSYDAQGNLASKNTQGYQFDMANRLRNASGLASYLYDAAGRRVQKAETGSGRLLDAMYSEAGQLMFQWEPTTQNVTDYIYLGDSLVARVVATKTPVTLSMSSVANVTSTGATLTANLSSSSATGTVTFTENGTFLGSTSVSGGRASIVLEGFPYGVHSITAYYSGDGTDWAQTTTFTIKALNLNWLPAVLNLLLQ